MTETSNRPGRRRQPPRWVALFAGFLLILLFVLRDNEPSYQGKSLSQWIRGLEYENENPTGEQRAALRAMGQPAVARLIEMLNRRDPALKQKFVNYARDHPNVHNYFIAPRHIVPENVYRAEAATALGEIGPAAQAAIPALLAASTNGNFIVATRAKAALIKVRQESIDPLLASLTDPQSTNWGRAAWLFKYLGADGQAAVPFLIKGLGSTNTIVREQAADALGGIAGQPGITIPALLESLKSEPNAGIRRSMIDALCQFKSQRQQIIPVLLAALRDKDNNVWLGAAFGLQDLLSADEKKTLLVPALIQSQSSPDEGIRENAKLFLQRNQPAGAGVK